VAKKRGRTTGRMTGKKKATTATGKAKSRPAPAPVGRAAKSARPVRPKAAAPQRARPAASPPEPVAVPLVDRATRLFDDIQRSKVTHPAPWGYTTKARGWSERAERLVADAVAGRDVRHALDGLAHEVQGDRDFQEARRLF
jgi:hypothetical protein